MLLKEQTETKETVVIEGHVYDAETGEYLCPCEKEGFAVTDERSAEWLGEKLSELDGRIKALELRKAAIVQNIDRQIADAMRHKEGMLWKYGADLTEYARANLPRGKRTYTNPFVTVAFRTVNRKFNVIDYQAAIEWAKANCPIAVKVTESFLTSNVSDALKEANPDVFEYVPERETVKIETGVGE